MEGVANGLTNISPSNATFGTLSIANAVGNENLESTYMQLELEDFVSREQQEWLLVLLTVDHQDIHYAMAQMEYPDHIHLVFEE
nr:hypothetical protein [Tanacetum cinerariifolium]